MRVRNVLFLVGVAAALGLGGDVATAQHPFDPFVVDGDWRDWGHVGTSDKGGDVIPDTNSTVDIIGYSYQGVDPRDGEYSPKSGHFVFIFEFMAPPFQGSDPTTVDLFFDVSADTTVGDPTPPWRLFRPDYRLTVTGQDGRLTSEAHRRYTGGRWQAPTEGADIPELEVALSGEWLEGAIAWSALGGDLPRPEDGTKPNVRTYSWAVQVSQGPYRDYVPDNHNLRDEPFMEYLTTVEAVTDRRPYGLILAVLLLSGPGRAQEDEFAIGAWFPGPFNADQAQWNARLQLVDAANFNTIHAALEGRNPAATNQVWMDEAHRLGINVQLYSWTQPPGLRGTQHWSQTFEAEDSGNFTHDSRHGTVSFDDVSARVGDHTAGLLLQGREHAPLV